MKNVPFKERARSVAEHVALSAVALLGSLLLALLVVGGIHVLDYVSPKTTVIQFLVSYSGIEGVVIFVAGSISLIRIIFFQEKEETVDAK